MNYSSVKNYAFVVLILSLCLSCSKKTQEQEPAFSNIKPEQLPKPELLIDFEQNGLVQPQSIELFEGNKLAILDGKLSEVLIFTEQGEFIQRFGGSGKGPGEFQRPLFIDISPNRINVVDAELYRVNQYDFTGDLAHSFVFNTNPYNSRLTLIENDKYAAGTMGAKGSLIKLVDINNDSTKYFGEAMGSSEYSPSLEIARQTLANGEIPESYKNQVTLYNDKDYLYAFVNNYSKLQKYTINGELVWDTHIDMSLNEKIFQRAVERAKDAPEAVVPSYSFISNMKVVNGEIYLFWMPVENEPRKLVRVGSDGKVKNIYHVPEEEPTYSVFTINPANNMIYFCAPRMGQIYKAKLPT